MKVGSVILAAGQGTRMKSEQPKVLHALAGKAMIFHCLETLAEVSQSKPVVVVGHAAQAVRQAVGARAEFVLQEPQLGTGHALMQVEPFLVGKVDLVLVSYADMPLLRAETLQKLVEVQSKNTGPVSFLTVESQEPRGFGRVWRDADGRVLGVVEEAAATPQQLKISELNVGVYCFAAEWLWEALKQIQISAKGEYYLTDLVEIAAQAGRTAQALPLDDRQEAIGINNRVHLAEAEAVLRQRINHHWMLEGVTLVDPDATYIDAGVRIGRDTLIWPNSYLQGDTQVGAGCRIGPDAILNDTQVGDRCKIVASVLEGALVEDEVDIGPFGHLRKGAHLARGVHMGNFGEVKNSYLGPGSKMGHFSYLGDATLGEQVNIGAGTITCNFDGEKKHPTEIGEGAFIGSDTMLVAPVKIGEGARTGAGSVVTKNVPPRSLAVGIPARVIRKFDKPDG